MNHTTQQSKYELPELFISDVLAPQVIPASNFQSPDFNCEQLLVEELLSDLMPNLKRTRH